MSISQLTHILSPPDKPVEIGSPIGWKQVQERLGLILPAEYKAFIDCYGTGSFSNGILVYNPFAKNENINLFQVLDLHIQANRQLQKMAKGAWSIVDPYRLYPAPGGLLPWGSTPNFEITFFWLQNGKPGSWSTIVYNLLQGEYEVWKFRFTHFLYKLLGGQIVSLLLHEATTLKDELVQFHPIRNADQYSSLF